MTRRQIKRATWRAWRNSDIDQSLSRSVKGVHANDTTMRWDGYMGKDRPYRAVISVQPHVRWVVAAREANPWNQHFKDFMQREKIMQQIRSTYHSLAERGMERSYTPKYKEYAERMRMNRGRDEKKKPEKKPERKPPRRDPNANQAPTEAEVEAARRRAERAKANADAKKERARRRKEEKDAQVTRQEALRAELEADAAEDVAMDMEQRLEDQRASQLPPLEPFTPGEHVPRDSDEEEEDETMRASRLRRLRFKNQIGRDRRYEKLWNARRRGLMTGALPIHPAETNVFNHSRIRKASSKQNAIKKVKLNQPGNPLEVFELKRVEFRDADLTDGLPVPYSMDLGEDMLSKLYRQANTLVRAKRGDPAKKQALAKLIKAFADQGEGVFRGVLRKVSGLIEEGNRQDIKNWIAKGNAENWDAMAQKFIELLDKASSSLLDDYYNSMAIAGYKIPESVGKKYPENPEMMWWQAYEFCERKGLSH